MATTQLAQIEQGESKYPTFTYTDSSGTPVNLSTLVDIQVLFKDDKDGTIFSKYARETATGWNSADFVTINAALGQFGIRIQAADSLLWGLGIVDVEIKIKEAATGFTPQFRSIYQERLFLCVSSKIGQL